MIGRLIPGRDAFGTTRANKAAAWPTRARDNRLFPKCTPQIAPKFQLPGNARVFAIGSCFARNIEEYLVRFGIDVASDDLAFPQSEMVVYARPNDLTVKYTPSSMLQEIRFALDADYRARTQDRYILEIDEKRAFDLQIPSMYPPVTAERARARRREINGLFDELRRADLVVLTLGLLESWVDVEAGGPICSAPAPALWNSHGDRFAFKMLGFIEAAEETQACIDLIRSVNPGCRFVITTSPVPLGRTFTRDDVIVANGHAKAVLRAVAGEIAASSPDIDYFPSYEMVTLSEAQATWTDDQRHVRDSRVGEIVVSFIERYFPDAGARTAEARRRHAEAAIQIGQGDPEAAYAMLSALREMLGHDTAFLRDLARAAKLAGHHREALALHERLDALGAPTGPRAMNRAELHALLGEHDKALAITDALLEAHPGHTAAEMVGIDARIALGQTDRARSDLMRMLDGLESSPPGRETPVWVFRRLARSLRSIGDTAAARRAEAAEAAWSKGRG